MIHEKDSLKIAWDVLDHEIEAIKSLKNRLGETFYHVVDLILGHPGKIILCGVGKSGHVGRKMAATFCSIGIPALFLHANEAMHGDFGIYTPGDPTILISKSGTTREIMAVIPTLKQLQSPLIAIVGNPHSIIAQQSDFVFDISIPQEADPLGIVPTSSSLATMALGDALAVALMAARNFKEHDFAKFHPGGQLGRNLTLRIQDVMHPLKKVAVVSEDTPLKSIVIQMTEKPLGGALVFAAENHLIGIITDGDIRRTLLTYDDVRNLFAKDIMNTNPITITQNALLLEAVRLMEARSSKIAILPVLCHNKRNCVGLIQLHDIYGSSFDLIP